jgi:hypothetical protein
LVTASANCPVSTLCSPIVDRARRLDEQQLHVRLNYDHLLRDAVGITEEEALRYKEIFEQGLSRPLV